MPTSPEKVNKHKNQIRIRKPSQAMNVYYFNLNLIRIFISKKTRYRSKAMD